MKLLEIILAAIIALFGLGVQPSEPEWIECGTCGAHVSSWWYVRNDADTDWVEVCELCYLRIAADDYYWPWD